MGVLTWAARFVGGMLGLAGVMTIAFTKNGDSSTKGLIIGVCLAAPGLLLAFLGERAERRER